MRLAGDVKDMTEIQKKANINVEQAIDKIATDVYGSYGPEVQRIVGKTLQLLANGCPVPLDEISIQLQTQQDKVTSTLRKWGAEFDHNGSVVGMGLTLVPTPHVYEVGGRRLHAWCAADALAFPVILNQKANIESPDPVIGEKIRVAVTPEGIKRIEPDIAVVSWVKSVDIANIRESVCRQVHFFCSPETAAKWTSTRPQVTFYQVNDVFYALKKMHMEKYRNLLVQQE